jgi:phytoene dehydrogenase-like protein
VEVVILEARDRVGGRVHSEQSGGLTCAVDLGASIITGTEIDTIKGLQPDPSVIIARYPPPPKDDCANNELEWAARTFNDTSTAYPPPLFPPNISS